MKKIFTIAAIAAFISTGAFAEGWDDPTVGYDHAEAEHSAATHENGGNDYQHSDSVTVDESVNGWGGEVDTDTPLW